MPASAVSGGASDSAHQLCVRGASSATDGSSDFIAPASLTWSLVTMLCLSSANCAARPSSSSSSSEFPRSVFANTGSAVSSACACTRSTRSHASSPSAGDWFAPLSRPWYRLNARGVDEWTAVWSIGTAEAVVQEFHSAPRTEREVRRASRCAQLDVWFDSHGSSALRR